MLNPYHAQYTREIKFYILLKIEIKETTTAPPTQEATTTPTPAPTTQENANNDTATNSTAQVKPTNATSNLTLVKETIKYEQVSIDLAAWPKERFTEVRGKLATIKEREKEKRKRAAAINSLETFLFDLRDKLEQDEFVKCSTADERDRMKQKADEVDAWLSDADSTVETSTFQEKLGELKASSKDVMFRVNEKRLRPKRLEELKEVMNKSMEFLESTKNLTGEDKPLTETEWNTLEKLINTVKVILSENKHSMIFSFLT